MEEKCENCKFMQPNSGYHAGSGDQARVYVGICRRFPPPIVNTHDFHNTFPWVLMSQWCGEFQQKT